MDPLHKAEDGNNYDTPSDNPPDYIIESGESRGFFGDFIDGFKRNPNASAASAPVGEHTGFDHKGAANATANSGLTRSLRGRHLQMIAIGGSIGTGLFVGSGASLAEGGPASVLISYGLIGIMMYCTVQSLGELAVLFPVAGSFSVFSTRFIDPAWGFAMGWNYAVQWLVVLPLEIVAASITIGFWNDKINADAWVSIFLVIVVIINLFGVRGYGEAEFVLSIIKVVAIIGYIILGIILNVGGGPHGGYIGGKYWHNPGAFHNGFKGLCSVFVNAAFAFGGTELVGLAAAETANPRRTLPTAIKQVFWRITLFYIVSLTLVGLLVPYNDQRLLDGSSSEDAKASPFVISIYNAGISGLPSVMNAVIMCAVVSVANSAVFGASRTMAALAAQRMAPSFLGYIDRRGRPVFSVAVCIAVGFLCFLAGSDKQTAAFNWMLALSGLSSLFTWGSINLAHIRFRRAWKLQGHSLDELAFRSQAGLLGSWFGFIFNCLVLIAQFWIAVWPAGGYSTQSATTRVTTFFQAYLAAPIVIILYVGHKLWYKPPIMRAKDMDLQTGIREFNLAELIAEDKAERASWPRWKRVYKTFC